MERPITPLLAASLLLPGLATAQDTLWKVKGAEPGAHLGLTVRRAGDTDGDGVADALVAAPLQGTAGAVLVVSGATGATLVQVDGSQAGDDFGIAVDGLGDVDGDGRSDFAVGSPSRPLGGASDVGRVEVFSGATGALLYRVDGSAAGGLLGAAVAGIGDVDGDGFGDLAVGAPGGSPAQPAGEVRVLSGATGSALFTWSDDLSGGSFGRSLADAGDFDGDGTPDVVIGAPDAGGEGFQAGRVVVRSGADGSVLLVHLGSAAGQHLGLTVDGAGDVDLDGLADVIVGSFWSKGPALVLAGGSGAELFRFETGVVGYAGAVAGAGDVDGDGFPDLAIGSQAEGVGGRVYLHSGRDGSLLYARSASADSGLFGRSLDGMGDLDGDGRAELLIGQSLFGPAAEGRALAMTTRPVGASYCGPAVPNSTGLAAEIRAFGSGLAARNLLHLSVSNLPTGRKAYFLTSTTQGFVANPGGSQGNLCLGGAIGRFVEEVQSSDAHGSIGIRVDLANMPPPVQQVVLPGETWNFQAWYRDVNPTKTSNFSDALAVTFS